MNILSTAEALESLNKRLQKPITRQLFAQSIAPVLVATGYARKIGRDLAIDGDAWSGWWVGYLALRERKIADGTWTASARTQQMKRRIIVMEFTTRIERHPAGRCREGMRR
ncbi:MAG: hypothetical protein IPM06_19620 [Rhizobiales bacterium]|nr:hypothetical protein [Hyphomicrobiales bacterium]